MVTFLDLPYEIRIQIWKSTVEPRVVPVRINGERARATDNSEVMIRHLVSSAPVPRVKHICRESRSLNMYEKLSLSDFPQAAYIWVNFDLDIIDIGRQLFSSYELCAHRIRRLKFAALNTCEGWYHNTAKDLVMFDNLTQCFVLALDSWESWVEAFTEHYWSCGADNLYIIDDERGRMMSFPEVEQWMDDDDRYKKLEEAGGIIGLSPDAAVVTFPSISGSK